MATDLPPRRGDRVQAGDDLYSWGHAPIPRGTEGTVRGERHDMFEHYVQVDFDNGTHAEIPASDFHDKGGTIGRRPEGN